MRAIFVLTCVLLCSTGCLHNRELPANDAYIGATRFANVRVYPMREYRSYKAFVTIDEPGCVDDVLCFVSFDNSLHVVRPRPDELLMNIISIHQSPDRDKVLIRSEGEGVAILSAYRIGDLVEDNLGNRKPARPVGFVGMYQSYPEKPSWIDDHTIQFDSEEDFTQFNNKTHHPVDQGPPDGKPKKLWRYDILTNSVSEAK